MQVSILPAAMVREQSSGEVTVPETLDFRTFQPIPGGLFCEQIFGPMPEMRCTCGLTSGSAAAGKRCSQCGAIVTWSKRLSSRSGHLELAAPVCHPELVWGAEHPLARWCGLEQSVLAELVYCTRRVDELTGAEAVRTLLQRAGNPDEGRAVLECLPVLPPAAREIRMLDERRVTIHAVNDLYRRVIQRNYRLRKLAEVNAPAAILDEEKRRLQETVDALIDNTHAPQPVLNDRGQPMKCLADLPPL